MGKLCKSNVKVFCHFEVEPVLKTWKTFQRSLDLSKMTQRKKEKLLSNMFSRKRVLSMFVFCNSRTESNSMVGLDVKLFAVLKVLTRDKRFCGFRQKKKQWIFASSINGYSVRGSLKIAYKGIIYHIRGGKEELIKMAWI